MHPVLERIAERAKTERLFISFSAGRTSADMTKRLLDAIGRSNPNVKTLFSNTGEEDENTLRFADECDRRFEFGLIWVEAIIDPILGHGPRAKVINFETASRNGEPFEASIAKHGLCGPGYFHCTRTLKAETMEAYLRSVGWETGSFDRAIGLRADEIDRADPKAKEKRIIYPSMEMGITKPMVIANFSREAFDLYVPEHIGNCKACWKKSIRKLMTLAIERPEAFDFARRMEKKYGGNGKGADFMFRGHRTVEDIFREAQQPFKRFVDTNEAFDPELDLESTCGDECEVSS